MRIIPTRIHGIIDYLYALALILSPFLFWDTTGGADLWVPIIMGTAIILYSICTDYEWGGISKLSMPSHLTLDVIGGILLIASPWIFGFSDVAWLPFVIFGFLDLGVSMMTQKQPGKRFLGVA